MKYNLTTIAKNILVLGLILSPITTFAESLPESLSTNNTGSSAQTANTVSPASLITNNSVSSAQSTSVVSPASLVTNESASSAQTANTVSPASLITNNSVSSAQTTTVTPPSSGGSSIVTPSTPSSGSSSSSGGGSSSVFTATNLTSCSYINTYFKAGSYNDGAEVVKLKTFLNNNEGFKLAINGNYDEETIKAVKSFQSKYAKDIMTPWGITTPTGHVFYTTQKKINELVCNKPIVLTSVQLAAINAYRNGANTNTTVIANANTKSVDVIVKDSKSNADTSKTDSQTATPVKTSFAGKVWKFTKWLFGY